MNRRINKFLQHWQKTFLDDLKKSITETTSISDILKHIEQCPIIVIKSSDYEKRQRTKNIVPLYERCKANRANGQQCTRRRKENKTLCGTHIKGTPHGIVDTQEQENPLTKIEVVIQEISGINYYIDNNNNIYDPQDVYTNKLNPRIIHKYEIRENGDYIIKNL